MDLDLSPNNVGCWIFVEILSRRRFRIEAQQLGISYIFLAWVNGGQCWMVETMMSSDFTAAKKYTHGISCDKVTRFTLELSWKIPSALFLNVSQFYEDHCSHFAVYLLTDLMWLFCIPHLLLVAGWWRWWRCCRRGSWSTTSGPSPSLTPWRTSPSHSTPSRRTASN